MDERWKSDGNCKKCRREKYCKKPCTAKKRRKERLFQTAVKEVLAGWMGRK